MEVVCLRVSRPGATAKFSHHLGVYFTLSFRDDALATASSSSREANLSVSAYLSVPVLVSAESWPGTNSLGSSETEQH